MTAKDLRPEAILAEIEELLRRLPGRDVLGQSLPESLNYSGRVVAVLTAWNPVRSASARFLASSVRSSLAAPSWQSYDDLVQLLHEAQTDLRLNVIGPVSTSAGDGMVFKYFDELRKLIEPARSDLFFIDRYLDADFVSRCLPAISPTVPIRLLSSPAPQVAKYLASLVPAAKALEQQRGTRVEVRTHAKVHDRFVIVDGAACYQSGASFKDGGQKFTTITQITDAFDAVRQTYEDLWTTGRVEA